LYTENSPSSPPQAVLITPTPISIPTTSAPVELPTSEPVVAPTRRPTLRPISESPTEPTETDSPTVPPTLVASSMPTVPGSDSPTVKPSLAPSDRSSESPSSSPKPTSVTLRPTISKPPTKKPSFKPTTRAPIDKPTRKPITEAPTYNPSQSPSFSPQNTVVSVDVILSRTSGTLVGKPYFDFESVTEAFLTNQLMELDYDVPVKIMNVQTRIYEQAIEGSRNRRRLQSSDLVELRVRYNAYVEYQSEEDSASNVSEWIGRTFNTKQKRELYISRLQTANSDAFDTVASVVVLVDGSEPPDVTPIEDKSPNSGFFSNENLWYIIGAVGGGVSLIIMISTLYVIGRNKRRKEHDGITSTGNGGKQNMTTVTKIKNQFSYDSDDMSPGNKLNYTAEIDVDLHNDDVSTLGDPTYYGGTPDQPTVVGLPTQNMMMTDPKYNDNEVPSDPRDRLFSEETEDDVILFTESNLSKQNDEIVVHTVIDDSSLDNNNNDTTETDMNHYVAGGSSTISNTKVIRGGSKYAVEVPPGKLGMIIDTPDNGSPIVHTIKPESILCTIVHAGDYLINVDDECVTHMTAVQVSKLISMKSDQQRTFTFLRKDPNNDHHHTMMNRNSNVVEQRTDSVAASDNDVVTEHSGAC
jgi:hypothetical protein